MDTFLVEFQKLVMLKTKLAAEIIDQTLVVQQAFLNDFLPLKEDKDSK